MALICQACRVDLFGDEYKDRTAMIKRKPPAMRNGDDEYSESDYCDACGELHSNGVYAYRVPDDELTAALADHVKGLFSNKEDNRDGE